MKITNYLGHFAARYLFFRRDATALEAAFEAYTTRLDTAAARHVVKILRYGSYTNDRLSIFQKQRRKMFRQVADDLTLNSVYNIAQNAFLTNADPQKRKDAQSILKTAAQYGLGGFAIEWQRLVDEITRRIGNGDEPEQAGCKALLQKRISAQPGKNAPYLHEITSAKIMSSMVALSQGDKADSAAVERLGELLAAVHYQHDRDLRHQGKSGLFEGENSMDSARTYTRQRFQEIIALNEKKVGAPMPPAARARSAQAAGSAAP